MPIAETNRLSRLEAVNIILRAAREHPVSSLVDDVVNESLVAEQILDEWNLHEQAKGLFNNTFERDFTPDATTGEVVLPNNILFVTAWGQSIREEVVYREDGGVIKLWDRIDETFDFSRLPDITLKFVLLADFELELTALQQRSIVDQAAQEYQMMVVGSDTMNRMLERRAARSRAEARAENMRAMKPNMFNNSRSNAARSATRVVQRPWWPESDGRESNRRT